MASKRDNTPDSAIMDALDATGYHIGNAASRLGVQTGTLSKWINDSDNLTKYVRMRTESDGIKARDKLNEILDHADSLDPRQMGHVISICKILLDKAESDKNNVNINNTHAVDKELHDKIKEFLDG